MPKINFGHTSDKLCQRTSSIIWHSVGEFWPDVTPAFTAFKPKASVFHLLVRFNWRLNIQKTNAKTKPPSTILDTGARYLSTSSY